jgi:hypothetical protein
LAEELLSFFTFEILVSSNWHDWQGPGNYLALKQLFL